MIRKSGALPIPQFYSFSSCCKQLEKLRIITHVIRKSGALPIPIILHPYHPSCCKQLLELRIITHVIRKSGALPIPIILHRFYSFSSFLQLPYLSSRT